MSGGCVEVAVELQQPTVGIEVNQLEISAEDSTPRVEASVEGAETSIEVSACSPDITISQPLVQVEATSQVVEVVLERSVVEVSTETRQTLIEITCAPGAAGSGGSSDSSGAVDQDVIAAQDLGGERVVRANDAGEAAYADSAQLTGSHRVLGLTLNATLTSGNVKVRSAGRHEFSGWAWDTTLPIFLGSNGALTQSPPTSGFILTIGFADTPTSIVVRIGRPVRRQ